MKSEQYQQEVKQAIEESFGFFFEELYNDLKNKIIPVKIIAPMVTVTNALIKDLKVGTSLVNPLAYKMAKQSNEFIIKMNGIFKIYMLNEVRMRIDEKKPQLLDLCQKGDENKSNVNVYMDLIKLYNDLLPFDLLVDISAGIENQRFDRSYIPELLEICDDLLSQVSCGDCNKYRHFKLCKDCKPRQLSNE